MHTTPSSSFPVLLAACAELARSFPEGVVFIGGIAVYLHAMNGVATHGLAETTHDADLYISLGDMADLRDLEELVPNRRLSKHQMVKHGFEFDVYTERQSSLVVPYEAISACAVDYEGIRVAALEHLLALKLEAFADRQGSAKGEKDARDLLRICAVSASTHGGIRPDLAVPFLLGDRMDLLEQVARGPQALALAAGNAPYAKKLRQFALEAVQRLREGLRDGPSMMAG